MLSIEQVAALLRVLKEPTRTMVFVAVFTGLRVGELLGLKWSDIDLQKMVVPSLYREFWHGKSETGRSGDLENEPQG